MPDSMPPDWRKLYPFASRELVLDGHRYHYLDEGAGPVLLLVHGNPTWSFYWRELIQAFRGRFRVVVPDHIGCGLSDKPRHYPYRLGQHVRNLGRLIAELDLDQMTLLAHDWGGAIGLGAAVDAPQRFSPRLPHAAGRQTARAGMQRLRPGRARDGRRSSRPDDPDRAGRPSGPLQ
jgi:pimeloyl-ACP methyl ester carboxylesterase